MKQTVNHTGSQAGSKTPGKSPKTTEGRVKATTGIKTAEDMVAAWDRGESIKLIQIGGPLTNELAHQKLMFNLLRVWIDNNLPHKDWMEDRPDIAATSATLIGQAIMTGHMSAENALRALRIAGQYYRGGYMYSIGWMAKEGFKLYGSVYQPEKRL